MKESALVAGVLLLLIGLADYSYFQNRISEYQTLGGQFLRLLSAQDQAAYGISQGLATLGIVFSVFGIALLIYGATANDKNQRFEEEMHAYEAPQRAYQPTIGETRIFCRYCGRLRSTSGSFCSECGRGSESSTAILKRCIHCNATMSEDSEFCANCGRKF